MTPDRQALAQCIGFSLAIGLLLSAALLWAVQPMMWTDPVPTAASLAAAHAGPK